MFWKRKRMILLFGPAAKRIYPISVYIPQKLRYNGNKENPKVEKSIPEDKTLSYDKYCKNERGFYFDTVTKSKQYLNMVINAFTPLVNKEASGSMIRIVIFGWSMEAVMSMIITKVYSGYIEAYHANWPSNGTVAVTRFSKSDFFDRYKVVQHVQRS